MIEYASTIRTYTSGDKMNLKYILKSILLFPVVVAAVFCMILIYVLRGMRTVSEKTIE